jgi:hypothetical protein
MSNWSPIKYMGFYDVPLVFITCYRGETYLFDCPFDEELEDDSDSYKVYLLPPLKEEDLPKDWTTLHTRAIRYFGEVPVGRVQFDPSRRQAIDSAILDEIAARKTAAG